MKDNKQGETASRKPEPRKFSMTIEQIKEFEKEPALITHFIKAYEQEPNLITAIIIATAKGALNQQKLQI